MATVGKLNEEALKRKERLKALRQKHTDNDINEDNESMVTDEPQTEKERLPKPIFRSYKPESEELKDKSKPAAKPLEVRQKIKDDIAAGQTEHSVTEVDLTNLAPRKPDWDLKRDVSKKLEKLERRTQRAIAELIRERLKASQEDFASLVTAGGAISRTEAEGDED